MRSLQQGFISQRKSSGWKLPLCYCNKCSVKFISLSILALEITFLPLHFEAMEVEMQLCCHLDRARCACWKKKNFLCCSSYYHIHCVFCVFFVVYFVFKLLPLRSAQNYPDAKKFVSFSSHYLTNRASSADPVISAVAAYEMGKNHKHKDVPQKLLHSKCTGSDKHLFYSSKHFTSCHSYM